MKFLLGLDVFVVLSLFKYLFILGTYKKLFRPFSHYSRDVFVNRLQITVDELIFKEPQMMTLF